MTQSVHTSWVISGSILFSFVTTQNNCSKRMFWLLPYFPGVAAADWSTLELTQMWRHLCGRKLLTPWLWVCPPDLRSGIFCIDKRVFYYHASCFALCSLLFKKSQLPKGFAHIILVFSSVKKIWTTPGLCMTTSSKEHLVISVLSECSRLVMHTDLINMGWDKLFIWLLADAHSAGARLSTTVFLKKLFG